jgi:hypothetical protein
VPAILAINVTLVLGSAGIQPGSLQIILEGKRRQTIQPRYFWLTLSLKMMISKTRKLT